MDYSKINKDIEAPTPDELEKNLNQLKAYIIDNSENIIKMFTQIEKLKQELLKSKRSFDTMSHQMLILKKKYIEPFEKLRNSITNKSNIDSVITLYENVKNFKSEIKVLKNHYTKNTLTLTNSNFDLFIKIKNYPFGQFLGIAFIKEETEWFKQNEEQILSRFRKKFEESIMTKDKATLLAFFDFYSKMDMLVNEIKNYSNKILKELMVETFLNKIIRGTINTISPLNMIYENILKIRKELIDFFLSLETYSSTFGNLEYLLKSSYDKKKLVLYEEIMETVRIFFLITTSKSIGGITGNKLFISRKNLFKHPANHRKN